MVLVPTLRDALLRSAPQGEVILVKVGAGDLYRPLNTGLRFSTKDATASL